MHCAYRNRIIIHAFLFICQIHVFSCVSVRQIDDVGEITGAARARALKEGRQRSFLEVESGWIANATESQVHAENAYTTGTGQIVVLWGCVAGVIAILCISAVFVSAHYSQRSSLQGSTASTLKDRLSSAAGSSKPHRGTPSGLSRNSRKQSSGAPNRMGGSSESSSFTDQTGGSSHAQSSVHSKSTQQNPVGAGTPLPGLPLCPQLIVPDGTRLACVVQNDVCRRRQELSFHISAVAERGGKPLFLVRVSEISSEPYGIYIETLGGMEQFAFLSTEDLWKGSERPVFSISRPWGLPYGTIQRGDNGEYAMLRGTAKLLFFTGDFANHDIQVLNSSGHAVAQTSPLSDEEYQLRMQPRTDAGLVILGLLAIDKMENDGGSTSERSSSDARTR